MSAIMTRLGKNCRTGCITRDHGSYSECARGLQINTGIDRSQGQKSWDRELNAYESAVRQGIQPDGTTMAKVEEAVRISDASGVAYKGYGVT